MVVCSVLVTFSLPVTCIPCHESPGFSVLNSTGFSFVPSTLKVPDDENKTLKLGQLVTVMY